MLPPQPVASKYDPTIWTAKFSGYRVLAWGREQVLQGTVAFRIRQEFGYQRMWVARALPGDNPPVWVSDSPEDCMRRVESMFTTRVEDWQAWSGHALFGTRKLGPQLVSRDGRKVG